MAGANSHTVRLSLEAGKPPSVAIVEATAALTNTEITDCPPLSEDLDPDALDSLFADRNSGRVTFEYAGCEVTVHGENLVTVTPD